MSIIDELNRIYVIRHFWVRYLPERLKRVPHAHETHMARIVRFFI